MNEEERHRLAMQDADDEDTETLEAGAKKYDERGDLICDEEEPVECPACGGPSGLMGMLGNRRHYNCRNCGAWSSSNDGPPPYDAATATGMYDHD